MTLRIIEPEKVKDVITGEDAEMDLRAKAAVQAAIERAKICKKPIAKYDIETERAYLEYPDGRKEYV